jgi:hypothetical protein
MNDMVESSPITAEQLTLVWKDNEKPSQMRPGSNLTTVERCDAMGAVTFLAFPSLSLALLLIYCR